MDFLHSKIYFFFEATDQQNKVADALNRRATLLTAMSSKIVGFEFLKELCENDEDFGDVWNKCNLKQVTGN